MTQITYVVSVLSPMDRCQMKLIKKCSHVPNKGDEIIIYDDKKDIEFCLSIIKVWHDLVLDTIVVYLSWLEFDGITEYRTTKIQLEALGFTLANGC